MSQRNQGLTVFLKLILSMLIAFSCLSSRSYAQILLPLNTEVEEAIPDAITLLVELGQLRRAYVDLQGNYSNYRETVNTLIKQATDEVSEDKDKEIKYWQTAYNEKNSFWNNKYLWLAMGVISTIAIVYASNR